MSTPVLAKADMRASRGQKPCECGINYPLCPICHETPTELRRCSACRHKLELHRFDEGNQVCRGCIAKRQRYQQSIASGEHLPEKRTSNARFSCRCAGLAHRVVGPKCRGCGLQFAPDVVIGDAWKRKPSAWALLMSGGSEE